MEAFFKWHFREPLPGGHHHPQRLASAWAGSSEQERSGGLLPHLHAFERDADSAAIVGMNFQNGNRFEAKHMNVVLGPGRVVSADKVYRDVSSED